MPWLWAIAASFAGPIGPLMPALGAARAQDAVSDADLGEVKRLSEELERLATRNAWPGVERTFGQLRLLGVPLAFDDWLLGAQAARARGDAGAVRDRLLGAVALRDDPMALAWLADIDTRYGRAMVRCDRSAQLWLEAEVAPLDPDLARSIRFARVEIGRTGSFEGLLPVGRYRLLDTRFGVTDRLAAQVDLRGARVSGARRRELRRAWRESP